MQKTRSKPVRQAKKSKGNGTGPEIVPEKDRPLFERLAFLQQVTPALQAQTAKNQDELQRLTNKLVARYQLDLEAGDGLGKDWVIQRGGRQA